MTISTIKYSIVLPIYNEQDNILLLYSRLTAVMSEVTPDYEMIFIDDRSTDNSFSLLEELHAKDSRVKLLRFSKNNGHQIAITSGLDYATGNGIVIMDADLQDPPELLPQFFEKHNEGYDIVYAQREMRSGESYFKRITAFLFYRVMKLLTNIDIPLDAGDFRLIDRKVADALASMNERNKFLRGLISWTGYKQIGIRFKRDARHAGTTNYTLTKMFKFALDGIFSFSHVPLKMATVFGFVISGFSFVLILWALIVRYWEIAVPGWSSLMIAISFIGGVQLVTLGIIGEYLGRIYDEVKARPLYLLDKKIGFTD
jgi:glycosyltransferase involved in cell wall biosynthesis